MSNNEIFNMHLGIIEDKRNQDYVKHPLIDVLKLMLISVICGIDELEQIVDYGKRKIEFLRKEYEIKSIPSKSTLTRIFMIIEPKWLGLSIVGILNSLIKEKHGQIMLDGKAIKSTDAIKKHRKNDECSNSIH